MLWRFHHQSRGGPPGPCHPDACQPHIHSPHRPTRPQGGREPRPPRPPRAAASPDPLRSDGCSTSSGAASASSSSASSRLRPRAVTDASSRAVGRGSGDSWRFDSISDAISAVGRGEFVVVLDDEARENEGDLIIAADAATAERLAFMVEHTSGVVCVGMEGADLDRLKIPLMVPPDENGECMRTAFTVSVDLRAGTSTGISAADRSATIRALADPGASAEEFLRPGHVFPLRARAGGVLARPGHTEAAVDLARMAGRAPAGVICEIVNREDGSMARTPLLLAFAREHGLKCVTIEDLIEYRLRRERPAGGVPGPAVAASGSRKL